MNDGNNPYQPPPGQPPAGGPPQQNPYGAPPQQQQNPYGAPPQQQQNPYGAPPQGGAPGAPGYNPYAAPAGQGPGYMDDGLHPQAGQIPGIVIAGFILSFLCSLVGLILCVIGRLASAMIV